MWFCAFVLNPCFLLYMYGFLLLSAFMGSAWVQYCFQHLLYRTQGPTTLDVALTCNKKAPCYQAVYRKRPDWKGPQLSPQKNIVSLDGFWNELCLLCFIQILNKSSESQISYWNNRTIQRPGENLEESMDFLPCHGAQNPYLSPHPFSMAQRKLTDCFLSTSFGTSQQKYYSASYFISLQIRKNSTTLQVSLLCGPGTDCRERRD